MKLAIAILIAALALPAGAQVSISGDSGGSVKISSGGGTPASPSGSQQYNNGGAFGAETTIYLTPSGGDDSSQITTACATGGTVVLAAAPISAPFHVVTGVTMPDPCVIRGAGPSLTYIENGGTTDDAFNMSYSNLQAIPATGAKSGQISDLSIYQKSGVTPVSGAAIHLDPPQFSLATEIQTAPHIYRVNIARTFGGVYMGNYSGNGVIHAANLKDLYIDSPTIGGNSCIRYNVTSPGGDSNVDDVECRDGTAGIGVPGLIIDQADTTSFTNFKCNSCVVSLLRDVAGIFKVRFVNPSIEDFGASYAYTLGGGGNSILGITANGGEYYGAGTLGVMAPGLNNGMSWCNAADQTADNINTPSGTFASAVTSSSNCAIYQNGSYLNEAVSNSWRLMANAVTNQVPFNMGSIGADEAFLGFFAGNNGGTIASNTYATGTSAVLLEKTGPVLKFYANAGTTFGVGYTPNYVFNISPDGASTTPIFKGAVSTTSGASSVASVTTAGLTLNVGDLVVMSCRGAMASVVASSSPVESWTGYTLRTNSTTAIEQFTTTIGTAGSHTFTCTPNTNSAYLGAIALAYSGYGITYSVNTSGGGAITQATEIINAQIRSASITTTQRTLNIYCMAEGAVGHIFYPGPSGGLFGILRATDGTSPQDAASASACEEFITTTAMNPLYGEIWYNGGANPAGSIVAINY